MKAETIKQMIWDRFWDKDGTQKYIDDTVCDIYDNVFVPMLKRFADYLKQQGIAVIKVPSKDKQCPCDYCVYDNGIDEALKEFWGE